MTDTLLPNDAVDADSKPERIVGIGASAGGLEALEIFFDNVPDDSGMAFVVIQHLSPDFESLMDQLLARHTHMPVHVVTEGVEIRSNHVYLIPPKKEMIISNGRLHLTDRDLSKSPVLPVDTFLRSLAGEMGDRAIAIILSGTGSDGSKGVVDVAQAGGLVIAQHPEYSKFDGMPRNAITTGCVTHIVKPESIPKTLLEYIDAAPAAVPANFAVAANEFGSYSQIIAVLRSSGGIDFSCYKSSTVTRRIERRMMLIHCDTAEAYLNLLLDDADERQALFHDLLIGVTKFLRDDDAFLALAKEVMPDLVAVASEERPVRVWIPACATGEEAYSIAMLLHEAFREANRTPYIKIFATDVHRESLDIAGRGIYGQEAVGDLSPELLQRYFRKDGSRYIVSESLRGSVVFAKQDVLKDAPFTKMDLVSCRNLLIYFIPTAQEKALALFHFALITGGTLFLGGSETLGNLESEFETISSSAKIFRKRRAIHLPASTRFSLPISHPIREQPLLETALRHQPNRLNESNLLFAYDALLEAVIPSGVLCDSERHILHVFGDAAEFLVTPRGRNTTEITSRVEGDLKVAVSSAIHAAQKKQSTTIYQGIKTNFGKNSRLVDLSVTPIPSRRRDDHFVLLNFRESDSVPNSNDLVETPPPADEQARSLISDLEKELQYTRENLQTTIEELETSNEELQATNEELMSSNEELQSTNEELHSVNEELYSVNSEHQRKISELTQVTAELDHLLMSTNIATVFLNPGLSIRKFTDSATQYFNLLPQDVGRPIQHVTAKFETAAFLEKLRTATETDSNVQMELRLQDRHALLQIQPFQFNEHEDMGMVISVVDVTELKDQASELTRRQRLFDVIANATRDTFIVVDAISRQIEFVSAAGPQLFGEVAKHWEQKPLEQIYEAIHPEDKEKFEAAVELSWESPTSVSFRLILKGQEPGVRWVFARLSPIQDQLGNTERVVAICSDLTELEETREAMRAARGWLREMVSGLPFAAIYLDQKHCEPNSLAMQLSGHPEKGVSRLDEYFQLAAPGHGDAYADLIRGDGDSFYKEPRILDFQEVSGVTRRIRVAGYRGEDQNDVLLLTDVTDSEHAQEQLLQALQSAEDAARMKSDFMATMSHEIRTPLHGLLGMADLLSESSLDARQKRFVGNIKSSGQNLLNLMNSILDLSRLESGTVQAQPEAVQINQLVNELCEAHLPAVQNKSLTLNWQLAAEVPEWVQIDASLLSQVLNNLLHNAIKFTDEGQVDLQVSRMSLDGGEHRLRFEVSDTGIGMRSEELATIFQRFEQAGSAKESRRGGSGLGLAIVENAVQLLGGQIHVASEVGYGAHFWFDVHLQTADSVEPEQKTIELSDIAALKGSQVLIAEDNPISAELLVETLREFGCEPVLAEDGQQALEQLQAKKFDIAILDWMMPKLDGLEVARRIRAESNPNRDIPLIAMTAKNLPGDRETCMKAGMNDYVSKPLRMKNLRQILQDWVNLEK